MTTPTVGLAVKFQPTKFTNDPYPPLLNATVTAVNSPTSVDLSITAGNGAMYQQAGVSLLQLADAALAGGFFARVLS